MGLEGGDFHLFLDAISIEAVFVSLCVGIQGKLTQKRDKVAQEQRDHLQSLIEKSIRVDTGLIEEIHKVVVPKQNKVQ